MRQIPVDFRRGWSRLAVLATVLLACLMGTSCNKSKSKILESDSEAVKALKKAGATIWRVPAMGAPDMIGQTVDLTKVNFNDEILGHLVNIENVTELKLTGEAITDATLEAFAKGEWKYLMGLDLTGTSVTDEGVKHLAALKTLNGLTLTDTKVTGAGLAELPAGITSLNLHNLQIGDEDLSQLKRLKRLYVLGVSGTQVTAAGINKFKGGRQMMIIGIKQD